MDRFPRYIESEIESKNLLNGRIVATNTECYERSFFNIEMHRYSAISIARGIFPGNPNWCLDNKDLKFYENFKGIFLGVLSRFASTPCCYSVEEMAEHFLKIANFWHHIIYETKPDVIYGYYIPHDPSSFGLYLVSKNLKIPYIFFPGTVLFNKVPIFCCSFSNRWLLYETMEFCVSSEMRKYLDDVVSRLRSSNENFTDKMYIDVWKNESKSRTIKLSNILISIFPYSIRELLKGNLRRKAHLNKHKKFDSWAKINRKPWNWPDSQIEGYWQGIRFEYLKKKKLNNKVKNYNKLCTPLNKIGRFVYFAAHLEPEAATLPTALENRHFFPLLKMISDNLPAGISLVYKENPLAFSYLSEHDGEFKSDYYYHQLKKEIKNIVFVKNDIPSWLLIDKSIGCASINGTIVLEGIFRGKYCLYSSSNFYDGLDGAILVKSPEDVKLALQKMICAAIPNPVIHQIGINATKYLIECMDKPTSVDLVNICNSFSDYFSKFQKIDNRKWEI